MTIVSISDTEKVESKPVACEDCEEEESVCEFNDRFLCYDCASAALAALDDEDDDEE